MNEEEIVSVERNRIQEEEEEEEETQRVEQISTTKKRRKFSEVEAKEDRSRKIVPGREEKTGQPKIRKRRSFPDEKKRRDNRQKERSNRWIHTWKFAEGRENRSNRKTEP